MKNQFGVTLTNRINPDVIGSIYAEEHVLVLDIRHQKNDECKMLQPKGIKEQTLKKLQNFQISYEQLPIDFEACNARQCNELMRTICEQQGNVLVLSNQSENMIEFCHDCHIPVQTRQLTLVHSNAFPAASNNVQKTAKSNVL